MALLGPNVPNLSHARQLGVDPIDRTMNIYSDTNLFLQCKDVRELDWQQLGLGGSVVVTVPLAVLGEIDSHKNKGNSRTARRARAFSSTIAPLAMGTQSELVLHCANSTAQLRLAQVRKADWSALPLDPTRPDD